MIIFLQPFNQDGICSSHVSCPFCVVDKAGVCWPVTNKATATRNTVRTKRVHSCHYCGCHLGRTGRSRNNNQVIGAYIQSEWLCGTDTRRIGLRDAGHEWRRLCIFILVMPETVCWLLLL